MASFQSTITRAPSCDYTALNGNHNMMLLRRTTATTTSPSEQTNILKSTSIVLIGLTLFVSAILMVIFMLTGSYCNYYIVLCVYQLVIIIHYGDPLRKYVVSQGINNNQNNAKSCFSVMYEYYCHCKIIFSSVYFIVTATLIFIYNIDNKHCGDLCFVVEPLSYVISAFSIPLPLICLKIYSNEKDRRISKSMTPNRTLTESQISLTSQTTNLFRLKPLRQEIIKFCTATVYVSRAICYILYPTMHLDKFIERTDEIYCNENHDQPIFYKIIYVCNQLYFRTFVGMLLINAVFAFVIVLFDPLHQFVNKKWRIFKHILCGVNTIKKPKTNTKWMYAVIVILCCVMILDMVQFISHDALRVADKHINVLTFLHNKHVSFAVNIVWIAIHSAATIFCWIYTMNFHAIANKTDRRQSLTVILTDINVNQTAFVIQATILLILNALNVTYLYQENYESYETVRQISIVGFMLLQAASLYFLISVISLPGKRARKSFKKNNWRSNGLIRFYFQFTMLVNIYDFVYLSSFKMVYFHQHGLNNKLRVVSYAFSFSSLTLLTLFIHQLIKSYGILNKEIHSAHSSPKYQSHPSLELSGQSSVLRSSLSKQNTGNKDTNSVFSITNVAKHNQVSDKHDPLHQANEINFGSEQQSSIQSPLV